VIGAGIVAAAIVGVSGVLRTWPWSGLVTSGPITVGRWLRSAGVTLRPGRRPRDGQL
jgi:hypothetical protein